MSNTTFPHLTADGAVTNAYSYGAFIDRTPPMLRVIAYNAAWELGLPVLTCIRVGRGEIKCMFVFSLACVDKDAHTDGRCHL